MPDKENPRRLVAQATGLEQRNYCNDNYSKIESEKQLIYDLLPQGEENAVASKTLANMIGVKTVRELQHMVAAERENGALILSASTGGYFLPSPGEKGQEEIARFVATLRSRAVNTFRALKTANAALSKATGQITLDELEGV